MPFAYCVNLPKVPKFFFFFIIDRRLFKQSPNYGFGVWQVATKWIMMEVRRTIGSASICYSELNFSLWLFLRV